MGSKLTLADAVISANTGLDAIKRAPIVEENTGIKCIRIQDVNQKKDFGNWGYSSVEEKNFEKFQLKTDDILIARTGGSVGSNRYIFQKLPAVYNNGLIRIRINKEKHNSQFIYYLLQTKKFKSHIDAIAYSTSAQPNMKIRDFLRFEFISLGLEAETKIGLMLSNLDKKIELNKQTNQTLEKMAQTLFKSWFVDFDPVFDNLLASADFKLENLPNDFPDALLNRAKNRLLTLDDNAKAALLSSDSSTVHQHFPNEFEHNEQLGWIPKGWGISPISHFGEVVCGKTPSKQNELYYGDQVPFIKIPSMHGNVFVIHTTDYLSDEGDKSQSKKRIPKDSICVSSIATVGLVAITTEPSHTNQQINSIIPFHCDYRDYLYFSMIGLNLKFHDLASGGSATLNMNTSTFAKVTILEPDENILTLFDKESRGIFNKIKNLMESNISLAKLRDTLLPKLISGELQIPDVAVTDEKIAQ